jgi:hypothetical protein
MEGEVVGVIFPIRGVSIMEGFDELYQDFEDEQDNPKEKQDPFICLFTRVFEEERQKEGHPEDENEAEDMEPGEHPGYFHLPLKEVKYRFHD